MAKKQERVANPLLFMTLFLTSGLLLALGRGKFDFG
jgi:hypothetical protein